MFGGFPHVWDYYVLLYAVRSRVASAHTKSTDVCISLCWWSVQHMERVKMDMWILNWWKCCCLILCFSSYMYMQYDIYVCLTLSKFIHANRKYPRLTQGGHFKCHYWWLILYCVMFLRGFSPLCMASHIFLYSTANSRQIYIYEWTNSTN